MNLSGLPTAFTIPWGNSAGGDYINAIPVNSQIGVNAGYASFADGFVPLNQTPIASGGIPPRIQDMNGILNEITAWNRWQKAGGPIAYDATFQSAVGGYPKWSVVFYPGSVTYYLNTTDANTTNPTTAGAGWIQFYPKFGVVLDFTSTQTWNVPAGVGLLKFRLWGAGGGGGSSTQIGASGSGGGGGGYAEGTAQVTPGSSISITVGVGGAGSSTAANGAAGSATSFGSFATANGGGGGYYSNGGAQATTAAGGTASIGSGASGFTLPGGQSGSGVTFYASPNNTGLGGYGGSAPMGGAGASFNGANPNGLTPGGGGAGGANLTSGSTDGIGGNGGNGLVIVEY